MKKKTATKYQVDKKSEIKFTYSTENFMAWNSSFSSWVISKHDMCMSGLVIKDLSQIGELLSLLGEILNTHSLNSPALE